MDCKINLRYHRNLPILKTQVVLDFRVSYHAQFRCLCCSASHKELAPRCFNRPELIRADGLRGYWLTGWNLNNPVDWVVCVLLRSGVSGTSMVLMLLEVVARLFPQVS